MLELRLGCGTSQAVVRMGSMTMPQYSEESPEQPLRRVGADRLATKVEVRKVEVYSVI